MPPVVKLSPEALQSLGSMEGAYSRPLVEKLGPHSVGKQAHKHSPWPGWIAAAAVSLLAYAIHYLPFEPFRVQSATGVRRPVSAAILAMLAGAIAGNLLPLGKAVLE